MKRKLTFGLAFLLIASITGISYAAGNSGTTTITVSKGSDSSGVTTAATDGQYGLSTFTDWAPVENSTGSTGTGDLYVVTRDTTNNTDPIFATLYLQNADQLANGYSYLNLNINVYGQKSDGSWVAIDGQKGMLSLTNGYIQFTLPYNADNANYSKYSISIDSGSFYTIDASSVDNLSPKYYLEIL